MQFFSGRFKEKASHLILDFHSSINFDKRLYKYDIMGSIAHVRGLGKQGIIPVADCELIEKTLREILTDIEDGKITFSIEYEDIHMNIEKILIDNISTYMPGFTHLQIAQPVSFSHYILAYAEMFRRDFIRLKNAAALADTSPLGSAALAGTTYPLDRNFTSSILGFSSPTWNSMDSVSDRDYLIEIMNAFALIMVHLSRFCEEIIIYSSNDFGYIELSDSFSTGSSIMPQKKNPDAAELIRGKSGRVFGDLMALLTTMKGIPLAYNKDMQEDKENFFDSLDTVKGCLAVFNGMIHTMTIKKERLLAAAAQGFINATDVADYLTERGMSFRDAYKIVGSMVAYCIDNNTTFEEISINTYKEFSELFEKDIYEMISIKNCVEKRCTLGGPGKESIKAHIEFLDKFITESENIVTDYKLNDIL